VIYLYGIVPASTDLPAAAGIAGAPLSLLRDGPAAAVTSEMPDGEFTARKRDLLTHSEVLQRLVDDGVDVLPLRFGTIFRDEEELRDALVHPNVDAFVGMLADVAGKIEVQVKAAYVEDAIAARILASDRRIQKLKSATQFEAQVELGRRFAEALDRARYADGRAIVDRLARLAERTSLGEAAGEYGVVSAAFLVARKDLAAFDAAVGGIRRELDGYMTIRYLGPLAPYSFVDAGSLVVVPWG